MLDFTPGPPELVPIDETASGVWRYRTPAPEFGLWRVEPQGGSVTLPAPGNGRVLLAATGTIMVAGDGVELTLTRGQAAFVPAEVAEAEVSGAGIAFVGGPGLAAE